MEWYDKVLIRNTMEIVRSATISIVVTFLFSMWYFSMGKPFEWKTISPIDQPSLLSRELYSAYTFVTIGAFLYYVVRLWKILYFVFVDIAGNYGLYKFVKKVVWLGLILLTYFYIFPAIVDLLNSAISLVFNLAVLLIYLFPSIFVFLTGFVAWNLIFRKTEHH